MLTEIFGALVHVRRPVKTETTVVVLGSKGAGKTTLIADFLGEPVDANAAPKPTQALEYTFARKAMGVHLTKVVAHVWELGGGTQSLPLIEIPISVATLPSLAVYIVLDLSRPGSVVRVLLALVQALRARLAVCFDELRTSPGGEENTRRFLANSWSANAFGTEHPDARTISPFPVPLTIVANKYDTFRNAPLQEQQLLAGCLRYIAHMNGATLLYSSSGSAALSKKVRALLNWHAFGGARPSLGASTAITEALVVPAASDMLSAIGAPPEVRASKGAALAAGAGTGDRVLDRWLEALAAVMPQVHEDAAAAASAATAAAAAAATDAAGAASVFAEPEVDAMRAEKDRALEAYRRSSRLGL